MPGKKARRDARLQQSKMDQLRARLTSQSTAPPCSEMMDCAVCLQPHPKDLLYQAQPCGHCFHFECMRGVYSASRHSGDFKCPLCRTNLESSKMDFEAFTASPQLPAWQWCLSPQTDATVEAADWMLFPERLQGDIEAAKCMGLPTARLRGAGILDIQGLTFSPAVAKKGDVSEPLQVRRCECLWKVSAIRRDDQAPGGYRLGNANWYSPSVSLYIEHKYQSYLVDPSCHTITDPSGLYVYCFKRKAFDVNPKLVAMLQWPAGQPRRARVITRAGDESTEPVPPDQV
eukprot:gnl/TRDRNA2_/TRDRNA2_204912_c0_seq1.p1 gnl/TRDRNA2_/TRDRNA2_204912_c0~~gnl/TRDRNA2_/TRDRNA2_204912_c0_seq1.p1  ORF type:complete len:287 (+),score=29.24 gnl/TRDRNA2_/TRDRNA2_204912_c0_seq1:43-903(+)